MAKVERRSQLNAVFDGRSTMNPLLARGARTGLRIAGAFWLLWALTIAITDKEPAEIREAFRVKPPQPPSSSGISFDLRTCSHCPDFLILDRGFGIGGVFAPLVLASLPALLVSRDYTRYWIPEVRPVLFGCMLLLEGMLIGMFGAGLRATHRAKGTEASSK